MDKLGLWFAVVSTLSTLLWFVFCLQVKNEIANLSLTLNEKLDLIRKDVAVHSAQDEVKHKQMDDHLEWLDARLDRNKIF